MTQTRIHNLSISLDGFATGEGQALDAPMGHAGQRLAEWMFATRFGAPILGRTGGTAGVDNAFAQQNELGTGAEMMGAGKFGPPGWQDDTDWKGWWGPNPPFHTPADGRDVRVGGGPTVVRDFLAAGLVDHMHLVQVVDRRGPLRLVTFGGGRGFVTYRDLGGADAAEIRRLVPEVLDHYRANPEISRVEWKTRGHDRAPGLHNALVENGFIPDEPESIMIGAARDLVVNVPLPVGVSLHRVASESDVRAMTRMEAEVFGDADSDVVADALLNRLSRGDGMELWVAEAEGQIVCAGRLDPVAGTEFAGIWGGATRERWRGRGIYRALTAARARSAIRQGKRLINSDSTEYSRPILERSGLVKVSTTTPYRWQR